MSDIENILGYAWAKDAVNLKPAIDSIMSAKAAEVIGDMTADVAASMFGAVSATSEEPVVMDEPQLEIENNTDLSYNEGTTDVEDI
jgi:hypothetical protein